MGTLSCPVLRRGEEWACLVNSGHSPVTGPGSAPPPVVLSLLLCPLLPLPGLRTGQRLLRPLT